ncbi:hypothetical protein TRFO_27375 [Tritrichomonas foetus]|uniref:PI3K/PI4K catalytic domain-containing protein n=1 Tax=Tritrichomonas foetus TaxID=1144522 RepID=A0A1J4K2H3_9EUKA|nr:hypothetical protein TRFO_27375 [Tritrichomonas foetus]|eukprot:OHT04992.1 hypothetical protein TRFO_27375 [Tritrichomonas foetus]
MTVFKNFFVSTLIGYLNDEFLATNLDSKREAIAQVITSVFKIEQEMVPHFIEPFLSNYLKYIEASSERHSIYFHYLRLLIESSGHLILPKSKLIYDSIQKHWHSEKTTKEASKVFCSLVVATMGRCEIILHNLVSESFLLLKVVDKSQMYAQEVFAILEIIAKLSPSYLSTIIAGIIEFLSISSVPQHLQTCSLQAIDFLVKYCQVGNRISAIKRCLSSIMQRSQARFREKANQIMNEINSFSRSQSLENLPPSNDFNEANNPNSVLSNNINSKINNYILNNKLNHSRNPKIIHIESINKYLKLPKELNRKNIINWFYELLNFLLNNSPSEIIQTMTYLDQPPKFAFKFAFIQMWIGFDTSKQREIARCLEKIFRCDVLPEIVLYKFIELIEFSFLCEIDLGVMIDVVIKKCVLSKHYSKALFFLESYIMYNPNIEISKDYKKTLVLMNNICGREYDARAIAIKEKEIFGHDVWMALGEWELALSCLKSVSEPDKYIGETVICHAALDDWKSIKDLENKFSGQSIFTQTRIAQYFWNAESFCGKNENAITYTNMTGGYSVDDSIEKAILLIKLNKIEEANKVIHLGWRYVGASISSVEKSNVSKIKNLLFRAEQLHELTDVINLIRDPNHSKTFDTLKTAWQYRLKLLKDDPLLQKEVFKIRSLCKDYSKASCEDLDDLSFHILYTTSRSHFSSMIPLMIKVFFPNIESEQAKLCKILYEIPPNEALTEAKELLKHATSSNLSILISDFVGKKMARNAKSLQDLEDSLDFLLKSNCSNQRLSKIYSLLAYVKNDPSYAEKSVELISKQTTKLTPVQLHHVLALLVGFKVPIKKLLTIITEANSSILKSVTHTALTLLGHKDEKVVKSCLKLMTIICNNFPQFVALDLINNDNLPHVQSLLLILQKDNPTITSQIMTLSSKFTSISNNLYETWIDSLNKCINFVQERKFNEANNCLSSLHSSLEEITSLNLSKYDQEFIDFYYTKLIKVSSIKFENIIRESNLNDEQNSKTVKIIRPFQSNLMEDDENISKIDEISSLVYTITKKLDSNRIIPLSFLDGLLERKNNWILYIFGSSDVKLSKIYNRLQRLDNGFKVSFIGSNGKKYNFHLLKQNEPKVRLQESEQFINLLNSMTSACDLVHRSVIQLSPNTLLIELLKGHLVFFDLVTLYESAKEAAGPNIFLKFEENNTNSINDRKSSFFLCNTDNDDTHAFSFESYDLGNNIETHYVNVEAKKNEEKSDIEYKSFEYQRAQKRLKKMQISQYESTLAKAIVVTSKNAMAWIQRTSMFAKSYGVLSAVSYIVGNVDTSPSAILFDKVSGAVTYTQFTVSGEALPIPFRLTKMIVGALGSSGVNGQFRLALESSIKRTRRFKSLIAPCLQFFVGEAPFDPIIVPQKYNKIYAIDKKATNNNITENKNEDENKCTFEDGKSSSIQYFDQIHEIDLFYERINGEKDSVKDDVDVLIEKASDINSMMKMPRKWISWW